MDLDAVQFVIVDVETTGLSAESGHRVCEVGAIRVVGGRESGRFHSLVNPERPVDEGARKQHGITDEELKGSPTFASIVGEFRPFLAGSVLVAQNAGFDLSFLNAEFVRCGMGKLSTPVVDTIPLARRVRPGLRSYNLDNLALAFRLAAPVSGGGSKLGRHRSLGDCELTLQVFLECLKSLRQRGEVKSIEDLVRRGAPR